MSDKSRTVSTGLHDRADSPQSRSRGNVYMQYISYTVNYDHIISNYKQHKHPNVLMLFLYVHTYMHICNMIINNNIIYIIYRWEYNKWREEHRGSVFRLTGRI